MDSDCDDIAQNRSGFARTGLCIAVAVAIVLAGVFVVWPWYINRLISQDVKERVLAADNVTIEIMRPENTDGHSRLLNAMGSQYMRWMADAVDFGGLQPDMGPLTGEHWTVLNFCTSGSTTLTLRVYGNPADIGKSRYPFLVGIEDHITNRKVTVLCSEKIYQLAEKVRKIHQDRQGPTF